MMPDIDLCTVYFSKNLTPGVHRCMILRDDFRRVESGGFRSGEADKDRFAASFEIRVTARAAAPCMVRGSIKIDGMEYGIFKIDGDTAKLMLKPTPWHDAVIEYELAACK